LTAPPKVRPNGREFRLALRVQKQLDDLLASCAEDGAHPDIRGAVSQLLCEYREELAALFRACAVRIASEADANLRDRNGLRFAAAEVAALCDVVVFGPTGPVETESPENDGDAA
jgi:hypothetical protein